MNHFLKNRDQAELLFLLFAASKNRPCEMFICECDRKASECFAQAGYNPEHEHYPSANCK